MEDYKLTTFANKYKSDKGSLYKCAHNYTPKYEQIISDIQISNTHCFDLLEIGLNRDMTHEIPSLLMWKDYFYDNINITGFDIQPHFLNFNSKYDNIKIFCGDQSNESDLQQLKYKQYDLIVDDGYHASLHQQISFKTLWQQVKSNGYYVIEDLHHQPEKEVCVKTRTMFENWKNNNWITTEYINKNEMIYIRSTIASIDFYDSQSKKWGNKTKNALVYIKKL